MIFAAWIYCKPAAWAAIAPQEEADKEPWHYPYQNAVTGFFKTYNSDFEVYHVAGSEAALTALVAQLAPADVAAQDAWEQGPGFDSLDFWPTDPDRILSVMKDLPGGGAPTREAPNWGHTFLGQNRAAKLFAGDFNNDFNRDFL